MSPNTDSWELQWHPASGGRVKRVRLSRRRRRRLIALLVPVLLIVLVLLVALPFGARTVLARVKMDSLARENTELHAAELEKLDRAAGIADRAMETLGRGRRLAWALGLPPQVWRSGVQPVPPRDAANEAVAVWLDTSAEALDQLSQAMVAATPSPPCPLGSLPSATPIDLERAVVVARYGWRISPFTTQREAHHGITVAAALGEPVTAPGAGRVVFAGTVRERRSNEWTRLGVTVVIDHGGSVYSVLGGLAAASVRRGDRVKRGDQVGEVGQTGWTRVPALYFEVRWPIDGVSRPIDPSLVCLGFDLPEIDERLLNPTASLPDDFARLGRLPRRGR